MIKVCHIVNLITGKSDGVYAHLRMIFQNYDKTRFEHFLIFQGGENIEHELSQLGIKVFVSTSLKKKISIRAFFDIYKILKVNKIDIIHTHLVKPYTITGMVNVLLRSKFIFNYHGLFLSFNPYYSKIEKLIYRSFHLLIYAIGKVDAVLVPSKRSKELLINETNLFPEPIVYYNGYSYKKDNMAVNFDLVNKFQKIKCSNIVIAIVGRLEIDKRIDRGIQIVKNLTQRDIDVNLLIFGDGSLNDDLQNQIKNQGLSKSIHFFGYMSDLQTYYKYFDILLFTSDWEGMPLSMWEAMANKVPIVAPDVGGFKEILEETNCGLIYTPGNLEEAEAKILQLINNEQLRMHLGQNGKSAIEEKYTEKNFITQFEHIYLKLVS